MATYEAFDPDVEVHGRTILTVVDDALARFSPAYRERAHEALAANGIEDPAPDEWYSQQAWLNAVEAIAADLEPHILDRLGEQLPDAAEWPDDFSGVEAGLRSIDRAYQRNHRGGDGGRYRFERTGERRGTVTCRNPYPCVFDRGLVRAVARRSAPVESFVFVEERGDACRRDGADSCTYTVFW
ncbi:MAG: hypothetical protein ABEJ82_04735 [Haloplanus sp.]